MGTRCLTVFEDESGKEIAVLYRQFDGYEEAHGLDLANLYKGLTLVNGYQDKGQRAANGMGCLAAQTISHFKECVGGFYLYPAGTRDIGEDFTYTVTGAEGSEPNIKAVSYDERLFDGSASDYLARLQA